MARRYQNIGTYTTDDGKLIYLPTKYPSVVTSNNDYYIIAKAEDRLDLIAADFYGDSMFVTPGFQLRIPGNIATALDEYDDYNTNN